MEKENSDYNRHDVLYALQGTHLLRLYLFHSYSIFSNDLLLCELHGTLSVG